MVSSAIYEGRGTVQTLRVLFKSLGGSMVVSSTTRGAIQALRVLLKSLGGRMGSYGGLQCHMRGYTDTQSAAPWSLSGTRGSWVVSSAMYEGIYIMQRFRISGCCSMLSSL